MTNSFPLRIARPLQPWLALVVALAFAAVPAAAQDWVEYVDETATRLVSDVGVGAVDAEEKDIISGDVDKDGDIDLLIARKRTFSTQGGRRNVLFMNENGVMTDRTSTLAPDMLDATDDRDIILTDVDGDTWLDAITVTTFSNQPRVYMNLGNDIGGNWQGFDWVAADNRLPAFTPGPKFCAVGFGDVTGNGRPDLFFTDYDNNLEDKLLINDGSGFFTDETAARMTLSMASSTFGTDAHIADFNGDGFLDILKNDASGSGAVPPGFNSNARILYNDGTGNFVFEDFVYTDAPYMTEPGDFNGDGLLDFYVVDDGQDAYLLNTGNDVDGHADFNTVTLTQSPNTAGFGGNTKVADLDRDGILDILVTDVDTDIAGCNRRMVVLQGQGPKINVSYIDPFNGSPRSWLPQGVFDVEALYINDDEWLDLWIATCTGSLIFIAVPQDIFADGFESGDTNGWSTVTP